MMKYPWILFDADETLFHFDNFLGLQHMMLSYGVDFTQTDYEEYQKLNKPLWVKYQNGEINAKELQTTRFKVWAERLSTNEMTLNTAFLNAMAEICKPLDGAEELLTFLKKHHINVGIITNGFEQLQQVRLEKTGFHKYIDLLVISEQVGYAKPDKRIFEFALSNMTSVENNDILMVGDTLASDILGGNQMGFDTCWLNASASKNTTNIKPTVEVNSLLELKDWLIAQ